MARQHLAAFEEFRFEAGSIPVTVTVRWGLCTGVLEDAFIWSVVAQLILGKAEVFGSEMALHHAYSFVETQQVPVCLSAAVSPKLSSHRHLAHCSAVEPLCWLLLLHQPPSQATTLHPSPGTQAVFSWHGCTLEISGLCAHSYVTPPTHLRPPTPTLPISLPEALWPQAQSIDRLRRRRP